MNINRIIWIVLDSVGIGEARDAAKFGDEGADTLGHTAEANGGLNIPNMVKLGIGNIDGAHNLERCDNPIGCFGKLAEVSAGKDTTIGHWEMAGIYSPNPFPVYPDGFPQDIIDEFIRKTGVPGILCNKPASGTQIIAELGDEHVATGKPIVYTSGDSVFQIACHEDVVPVETLYEYCKIARKILMGAHAVARVIARPFVGQYPNFERTDRRHDFSLVPPKQTVLDDLKDAGKDVIGVGKIYDIFAGKGITETTANHGNKKNMEKVFELQKKDFNGLCYINLVDFDMIYGHRRDILGYTTALNEFDKDLEIFLANMRVDDVLFITADHGCDPGYKGTDHTRESVPLLGYSKCWKQGVNIGTRDTYADIAATLAQIFEIEYHGDGTGFLEMLK